MAMIMMIPPMVGVPTLASCPSISSGRIASDISLLCSVNNVPAHPSADVINR